MSEAILFGVTQNIIENLESENFQEIGSIYGVEAELKKINNAVSEIKSVLEDAAERQIQNDSDRDWLRYLNDVIYEVDDLLSEFSTEALQRRVTSEQHIKKKVRTLFFFSSSNSSSFSREMGHKLMEIRKTLTAIVNDGKHSFLKEPLVEEPLVESTRVVSWMLDREADSFVSNDEVIGREDDKRAIIKLLLERNVEENVSVIPIVGIGGLGKTTLMKYVYNDEIVRKYFDLIMWVCVSHDFNVKRIIEKILMAAGRELPNLAMDQLEIQLSKTIEQKKYLLVLDDVWNEDPHKWDILKSLLMECAKGSKIVITTRSRLVAEITNPVLLYTLRGLSEGQSWSLLKQMVLSRKRLETINDKLETIGREILHKCHGVPLTIKAIGRVLCFKKNESEWIYVKDEISRVTRNVISQERDILSILKLSYDYLPLHLKACFAFCSLFPKDYAIDKETLIQLWIAQGLIQPSNKNIPLEDVADEYFKDLLWRSFFQEVESLKGKFMMHDLIHDLAQIVVGVECKAISLDDSNIDEQIHHVSFSFYIDSSFTNTLSSLVKTAKIRTILLTFREYRSGVLDASMLNTIILSLKSLRALDLHGLKIARVPNSIDKLILLKYLDLSFNNKLTFLPESITRLRNLQTLKLSCCWSLKELPKDIGELVNLEHLCNIGCEGLNQMPLGFGEITSLRTLSLFVVHKDSPSITRHVGGLEELYHLNNLRGTLEIKILERLKDANLESKGANLKEKRHLERLRLKWYNVVYDGEESLKGLQPHQNLKYLTIIGYAGVRISSWLSLLTNLVDLSLERCKRCRYLPPLSLLPSLESIHLLDLNGLEFISDDISEEVPASLAASKIFFPSLKSLTIDKCANLKGWWRRDFVEEVNNDNDSAVATSASILDHHQQHQHQLLLPLFPCLSSLYVNNSPKLTSMPLFPYLEECLCLINVSLKPLRLTMAATSSVPSASSSPSPSLSKLKSMTLELIKDIEYLPNEWVSNLTSLQSLKISKCPEVTSLFGEMQFLTSLRNLEINNCEKFDTFIDGNYDGMELEALNGLRSLTFESVPKLKLLPSNLQYVTSLQELKISKCPNLMIMPSWIGNLTSLEQLEILTCPNLTSLPDGIRYLSSLQRLRIAGCPFLEERCRKEIGEDWHKIAHIQDISNEL